MTHAMRICHQEYPLQGATLRPEDIGKPLASTIAGHHRHAILILDASGIIRFATTRELFGRPDDELSDTHLRSLIPSLPVRRTTPGYNIAYVRLAFADQGWQIHRAVSADGGVFPVELSVRMLPIGRSYALLAAVRELRGNSRPDRARFRAGFPVGHLLAA